MTIGVRYLEAKRTSKGGSVMNGFQAALAATVRAGSAPRRSLRSLVARLGECLSRVTTAESKADRGDARGKGNCLASETAYYVNPTVQALARVSGGVRLPSGHWIRLAGNEVPAWQAESDVRRLFPTLSDATLYIFTLHTELDVDDFERCFGLSHGS